MDVEINLWLGKDEAVAVSARRIFKNEYGIDFPQLKCTFRGTYEQVKMFAEDLMSAVMGLPTDADPYPGDKTKGDAFEALRRAES